MSNNDTNRLLGKLLGETYRLQRKMGVPVSATEQRIFGLLIDPASMNLTQAA